VFFPGFPQAVHLFVAVPLSPTDLTREYRHPCNSIRVVRCADGGKLQLAARDHLVRTRVEEDRVSEIYPLLNGDEEESGWQERALCSQTDPEAFFPEKGGSTRDAKKVCLVCDVRQDCLEFALANDERFGIWGGLSERERRRMKKAAV